jgi:ligand-binding sensor domain-containing protein/two-component sensor histidine kinase
LWFCTDAGLSRFDGRNFFTLTTSDGLPHPDINDLVQDKDGTFWLAGDGGISRFSLRSPGSTEKPKIETFRSETNPGERFDAIEFDSEKRLWAGAKGGLYRIEREQAKVSVRWQGWVLPDAAIPRLLADRKGGLWIATWKGAVHRDPAGRLTPVQPSPHSTEPAAEALFEDREGVVWIGHRSGGLCRASATPAGRTIRPDYCIAEENGDRIHDVRSILESSDGRLWIGATTGFCELERETRNLFCYGTEHGLPQEWIAKMNEDPAGNLWLGTLNAGVIRLARPGFVQFSSQNSSMMETREGWFNVPDDTPGTVHAFDLESRRPLRAWSAELAQPRHYGRHRGQGMLGDAQGNWWLPSGPTLHRYAAAPRGGPPRSTKPDVFTLPPGHWFDVLMESRSGAFYASVGLPERDHQRASWWLAVLEKGSRGFRRVTDVEPVMKRVEQGIGLGAFIRAIREDRTGAMWLGIASNRIVHQAETVNLLRRRDGKVDEFSAADGLPPGSVTAILPDRAGRLWIGTRAGLARTDDPLAPRPRFQAYGREQGMSSVDLWCLVEDEQGRIYAGTDRGVDRFDPASGRFRHFTSLDGLPPGDVFAAGRDRKGRLWFVSHTAVSYLEPEPDAGGAPPVFVAYPSAPPILRYDRNHIEASFSSSLLAATPPRFQFRLKGIDDRWSAPVADNTVRYAGLGPGDYELQARAVNADGDVSPEPASVKFTVTPPFWRTWWFLTLALGSVAAVATAFHRYRVAQILAVERLRLRIASDLHDDIGSTLAQVSMLGELAKRSLNGDNREASGLIDRMAEASRHAVSAMSDIVWSIHPGADDMAGLSERMRRFGCELLSSRGIDFELDVSEAGRTVPVGMEARRDLLLIFKESIHNAARHSGCRSVQARVGAADDGLWLSIRDDGTGFDPTRPSGGRGLMTMRTRAERHGGRWEVTSGSSGTKVEVLIPATRRTAV